MVEAGALGNGAAGAAEPPAAAVGADLPFHRGWRRIAIGGGRRETQMPGGRFEGA